MSFVVTWTTGWRSKSLLFAGCAYLVLLGVIYGKSHLARSENARLGAEIRMASLRMNLPERVTFLQRENDRIKAELQTIPELRLTAEKLESVIKEQRDQSLAIWQANSNYLQEAIAQKRKELQGIADWTKELHRTFLRKAAEARLAEKAADKSRKPDEAKKEYGRLQEILRQIGLSTKKRIEIQREWAASDKSAQSRTTFLSGLEDVQSKREVAMNELGKDAVLYDQLPVTPTNDFSKTPLMRSVVPDLNGVSVTLYLDGSVVWAPAQASDSR